MGWFSFRNFSSLNWTNSDLHILVGYTVAKTNKKNVLFGDESNPGRRSKNMIDEEFENVAELKNFY